MNQPPIPSPWPEPDEIRPAMSCPYCKTAVKVTWGRYMRSGLKARFRCSQCHHQSRAAFPLWCWVLTWGLTAFSVFAAVPFTIWHYYLYRNFDALPLVWLISYLLIALPVVLPINKDLYSKFGVLKKIKIK